MKATGTGTIAGGLQSYAALHKGNNRFLFGAAIKLRMAPSSMVAARKRAQNGKNQANSANKRSKHDFRKNGIDENNKNENQTDSKRMMSMTTTSMTMAIVTKSRKTVPKSTMMMMTRKKPCRTK